MNSKKAMPQLILLQKLLKIRYEVFGGEIKRRRPSLLQKIKIRLYGKPSLPYTVSKHKSPSKLTIFKWAVERAVRNIKSVIRPKYHYYKAIYITKYGNEWSRSESKRHNSHDIPPEVIGRRSHHIFGKSIENMSDEEIAKINANLLDGISIVKKPKV